MLVAFGVYHLSRGMAGPGLQRVAATVSGAVYFVCVALGAVYVYIVARLRGASFGERVLACAVTPFVWATGACAQLYESHPLIECLYWYLSPLNIWLATFMVLEMGVCEIFCRRALNRRGMSLRVVTPGVLSAVGVSLFLAVFFFAWGRGENLYVMFLAGYRMIFGSGL